MLAAMDSWFRPFRPHQHGIASKQAQVPKKIIKCNECAMFVECGFKVVDYGEHNSPAPAITVILSISVQRNEHKCRINNIS